MLAVLCATAVACGGGTKPAASVSTSASASPTISSVLGLPIGAIDRARVLAACTDIRQAQTLLDGGVPAAQVEAQLRGAADALGPPAALAAHRDVVRLVAAWRLATTANTQRLAVTAALAWCAREQA